MPFVEDRELNGYGGVVPNVGRRRRFRVEEGSPGDEGQQQRLQAIDGEKRCAYDVDKLQNRHTQISAFSLPSPAAKSVLARGKEGAVGVWFDLCSYDLVP